jgi:O-antigen/teichoic acid export membrane protein
VKEEALSDHDAAVGAAMARIARGGTASLVGAAASAVSSFVLVILVTRLYDVRDAGSLFASVSVFLILLAVVELGVDQGFVRFIAWYRARHEEADVPAVLRAGYLPVLVVSLAVTGIGFIATPALSSLVSGGEDSGPVAAMLPVLAAALPIAAAYELTLAATRGYGTMRPTVLIERFLRPGLQPIGVLAAAALDSGVIGLTIAWAAPYLVGLGLALLALARVRRPRPVAGAWSNETLPQPIRPRPARIVAAEFWLFTAPRCAARVCQVALQRIDVVLIAALRGPRDAAIYTAVTRFIVVGQTAMQAAQQVLQPKLAELLAVNDVSVASAVFQRATAWFVALTWPLYLIFAVNAGLLASMFGSEYDAGASSLVILSLGMLAATAAGPVDVLLVMAGRSGLSLLNTLAALFVDVMLCVLLVPQYGVLGAAIARTTAILVRNVASVIQVRLNLGMTAVSPALLRVVMAAVVLLGVIPAVVSRAWPGAVGAMVIILVATAAYMTVLWRWRDILGLVAFTALRPRPDRAESRALSHLAES